MNFPIIAYVAVIAVLVACSAFFSMSETAFTSANQVRLKTMAREGNARAEKAVSILEDYDRLLTTVLIGNNLVNIAATTVAALVFTLLLGEATGSVVSTVVMTLLVLTLGEIVPKTAAKRRPEEVVLKIVGTVNACEILFSPLSKLFGGLTKAIGKRTGEAASMTEEELEVMIDEIEDDGVLEETESELIKSAIRFDDTPASEVYVPRVDVVAVDVNTPQDEVGRKFSDTGFSRIPAFDGNIDNIVGVIYAKEFYSRRFNGEDIDIKTIVRPVRYVPETMSIAAIFSEFQKTKVHMAVVLDSYGGTMGIITLEDILEELVGEIWDESDDVEADAVRQDDGSWLVKGTANIYDVMSTIGTEFDPEQYEDYSVMGFVVYKLNRAPVRGDTVRAGNTDITVRTVKGRRITECLLTKRSPENRGEPRRRCLSVRDVPGSFR